MRNMNKPVNAGFEFNKRAVIGKIADRSFDRRADRILALDLSPRVRTRLLQAKRDLFCAGLRASRFELLPCEGTYFVLTRYDRISDLSEGDFVRKLVTEHGVAAIPIAGLYLQPFEARVVRFCFAKKDETLRAALDRLVKV